MENSKEQQKGGQLVQVAGQPNNSSMGYYSPEHLEQALRIADKFFKAGCFGDGVENAEQAYVIMQAGAEMGMPPVEAMNSFYIVNGKLTIYGTALAKQLRLHGWSIQYQNCSEKSATVKIQKGGIAYEFTATKEDVEKLGSVAYKKAPTDKLKWHAISRLVRQNVPEVLGPVKYTSEEAEDFVDVQVTQDQSPGQTLESILKDVEGVETLEEYNELAKKIGSIKNTFTDEEKKRLISAATLKRKSFLEQEKENPKEEEKVDEPETEEAKTPSEDQEPEQESTK